MKEAWQRCENKREEILKITVEKRKIEIGEMSFWSRPSYIGICEVWERGWNLLWFFLLPTE